MTKTIMALAVAFAAVAAQAKYVGPITEDGRWNYNNGENGWEQAGQLVNPPSAFEGVPTDGSHPADRDGDGRRDYNNGENGWEQAGSLLNPPSAVGPAAPGTYLECPYVAGMVSSVRGRYDFDRATHRFVYVGEFCDYEVNPNGGD